MTIQQSDALGIPHYQLLGRGPAAVFTHYLHSLEHRAVMSTSELSQR